MADLIHVNGYWTGNQYLTLEQMQENATWIYGRLRALGWTYKAIYAFLGNAQQESTLNPGLWEDRTVNTQRGFGLVQWTPSTKYTSWCAQQGLQPNTMDAAIARLTWEMENPVQADQWYPVGNDWTFAEWAKQNKPQPLSRMVELFMLSYERPAAESAYLEQRQEYAEYWQQYFDGIDPVDPPPTPGFGLKKKWIFDMRCNGRLAYLGYIRQRRLSKRD